MTTITLSLPDALSAFVDDEAAARGYESGGEYIRALIRDEQARRSLRGLLLEGAASSVTGVADEVYFDELRDQARRAG